MPEDENWIWREISRAGIPLEVLVYKGAGMAASIEQSHLDELCAWIAGFGVDPRRALPEFVILHHDEQYHLHLSVKVQRNGRDVLDQAIGKVWSEPVVIPLGSEPCWPKWLYDTREVAGA